MKITFDKESLARLSDEENGDLIKYLLVNKWKYLTKSFMGMVDAEMQDQFMTEQADIFEMQKSVAKMGTETFGNGELI